MMFFCVFVFIIVGFEYSVVNMGVFFIVYFVLGGLLILLILRNLLWVMLGNIIGGGVLLGLIFVLISVDDSN